MSLVTTSDNTDAQHTDIQLILSWPEAERLRVTLPWLLRALADRPTAPPQQRERRRKAHTALEGLLTALSSQLQRAKEGAG
jgi:hypothetical protein